MMYSYLLGHQHAADIDREWSDPDSACAARYAALRAQPGSVGWLVQRDAGGEWVTLPTATNSAPAMTARDALAALRRWGTEAGAAFPPHAVRASYLSAWAQGIEPVGAAFRIGRDGEYDTERPVANSKARPVAMAVANEVAKPLAKVVATGVASRVAEPASQSQPGSGYAAARTVARTGQAVRAVRAGERMRS